MDKHLRRKSASSPRPPQHHRFLSVLPSPISTVCTINSPVSLPGSPCRSALRSSIRTTTSVSSSSPSLRKVVTFSIQPKVDLKWSKDLISEFNLEIPKRFEYKQSVVRTLSELASSRDHITTADFWSFRQKLRFVKQHNLGPLLRKKRERSPNYELRLIARLAQPASPFQMDNRTMRLIQEQKTALDFRLMNNNEDPWHYSPPRPQIYTSSGDPKPTIDEWGNHPMYRPTSRVQNRRRAEEKKHRVQQLDAFVEALDVAEHL